MKAPLLALGLIGLTVAGCAKRGEIDATGGITAVRSACPVVGLPAGTGDVTLFTAPGSTDAAAVDVTATMTNVRGTCNDAVDPIATTVTFEVRAVRTATAAPRDVTLPYFISMVRGGTNVVAKRVGQVVVHFDAGQARASATGQVTGYVTRAAASLPDSVREEITRKRKAGDEDAATDPLTRPEIRTAVLRATFEALVGFQLTDAQLRYNATR
ncbi:MAG TPA: hypothetical protein VFQ57_08600 [Sphingomonas sp.]|nr:hypothetical protein [Sphingomonas sp.]